MKIANNLQYSIIQTPSRSTVGGESTKQTELPLVGSKNEAAVIVDISTGTAINKSDLKEKAREMLTEPRKMGEFKDKKGLEETTDLQIGPDIRYALKSNNTSFLKRISWGPLTVAEYREVKHRLSEIASQRKTNQNIMEGKLIDLDQRRQDRLDKAMKTSKETDGPSSILNMSV